jgi:hypothetical protein
MTQAEPQLTARFLQLKSSLPSLASIRSAWTKKQADLGSTLDSATSSGIRFLTFLSLFSYL